MKFVSAKLLISVPVSCASSSAHSSVSLLIILCMRDKLVQRRCSYNCLKTVHDNNDHNNKLSSDVNKFYNTRHIAK